MHFVSLDLLARPVNNLMIFFLIKPDIRLNTNLFPDCEKLTEYFASTVNVVSCTPHVGPSPRIKIYFPLLSTCTDELISAPKIMTFFSMVPSSNENSEQDQILCRNRYTCKYLDHHS